VVVWCDVICGLVQLFTNIHYFTYTTVGFAKVDYKEVRSDRWTVEAID